MADLMSILRVRARRVRGRTAGRDDQRLSVNAAWVRVYRRTLSLFLVAVSVIAFIEVVLLPGEMIRRNLNPAGTVARAAEPDGEGDESLRLPHWLMTDADRADLRQRRLDRIEGQLRSTHKKLTDACSAARNARAALVAYAQQRLSVGPTLTATDASLSDVLVHESTGRAAWARVLAALKQADAPARDGQELAETVRARFAAGSFLPDDDRDMRDAAGQLDGITTALVQARVCVDHLCVLRRERAALARQRRTDVSQQGVPQ